MAADDHAFSQAEGRPAGGWLRAIAMSKVDDDGLALRRSQILLRLPRDPPHLPRRRRAHPDDTT